MLGNLKFSTDTGGDRDEQSDILPQIGGRAAERAGQGIQGEDTV